MNKMGILKQPGGIAAVSAAVSGLAIHMFGLVTVLHNYDDVITHPVGYGTGAASGRWFLDALGTLVESLSFGYNLSWVNGLLYLFTIALSAGFLVSAVGLRNKKAAALWGALMVCFPPVTATMLFRYTAAYYGVSLFLAVFAVWVLPKHKLGVVVSVLCIACSMGIYQAYVPVSITLFVMILLKKLLDEDAEIMTLVKTGIYYCVVLLLGLVVYYGVVKLTTPETGLNSYQGISEMGQMSLKELLRGILTAIKGYFRIPLFDSYDLAQVPLLRLGYGLAYILTFVLIWIVLILKRKSFLNILAAGALWLVFPVAVNFVEVMTKSGSAYSIMVYPFVLIFCLPSLLAEWMPEKGKKLHRAANALVTLVLAMMITLYGYWANVNYTAAYYANRQAENYMNSLFVQVRMTEGFDREKEWAFLGQIEDPLFYSWWDRVPVYASVATRGNLLNGYSNLAWPVNYLGYAPPLATDETIAALRENARVQAMPCWPDYGSIAVIGDQVVIKFQN